MPSNCDGNIESAMTTPQTALLMDKLKTQASVLKRAYLSEKSKREQLETELGDREKQVTSLVQDMDSLTFNNRRLTKRCSQLVCKVQDLEKQSKAGRMWIPDLFSNFGEVSGQEMEKQLSVALEELAVKIKENETLHMQLFDANSEHQKVLSMLQNKISDLKTNLTERDAKITILEKEHRKQVRDLEAQVLQVKTVVEEKSKAEKDLLCDIETTVQENMQLKTQLKQNISFNDNSNLLFNSFDTKGRFPSSNAFLDALAHELSLFRDTISSDEIYVNLTNSCGRLVQSIDELRDGNVLAKSILEFLVQLKICIQSFAVYSEGETDLNFLCSSLTSIHTRIESYLTLNRLNITNPDFLVSLCTSDTFEREISTLSHLIPRISLTDTRKQAFLQSLYEMTQRYLQIQSRIYPDGPSEPQRLLKRQLHSQLKSETVSYLRQLNTTFKPAPAVPECSCKSTQSALSHSESERIRLESTVKSLESALSKENVVTKPKISVSNDSVSGFDNWMLKLQWEKIRERVYELAEVKEKTDEIALKEKLMRLNAESDCALLMDQKSVLENSIVELEEKMDEICAEKQLSEDTYSNMVDELTEQLCSLTDRLAFFDSKH